MDIDLIKELAESIKRDYESQSNGTMRWLQDYRKEVKAFKEYRGREVFELLQNADDAQSDTVEISIDTERDELMIKNSGNDTRLFTYEGVKSILLSDISPKAGTAMIGKMGLGFRSVLNWADRIEIRSDNLSAEFSSAIAKEYWDKLKGSVVDAGKYEAEARMNGREVPLAILAMPKIKAVPVSDTKTTSIILRYDEGKVEESILNNLKTFQPEFMLFLKHVTRIVIKINGEQYKVLVKEKVAEENGISTYKINDCTWAVSSKCSDMNDRSQCETACAFCMDAPQESYSIYTYFPTKVDFPFPCILHATLELDSSRNSLLPDNRMNREVISRLTEMIKTMADYLKNKRHDWYPYLLARPDATHAYRNEYVQQLVTEVRKLTEEGEYVPTFDGKWASESGCYHYSEEMSAFLQKDPKAEEIFPKLRLTGAPKYASLNALDPDAVGHVNRYFKHIAEKRDLDLLGQALRLLLECSPCHDTKFNVLPDDDFRIISDSNAYINTGEQVEGIPEFRKIRYVNKELVKLLLSVYEMQGEHKERLLAERLKKITDVIASDISAITERLIPKKSDENLTDDKKAELLKALFNLCRKRDKTIDRETLKRTKPYLMSQTGEWVEADTLVFLHNRFPSGFGNLEDMKPIYGDQDGVAFPYFLMDIEDVTEADVEAFYASLGVSRYLKYKWECFGGDTDYVNELMKLKDSKLPSDFNNNCKKDRVREGCNMALVPDPDCFKDLSLNQALSLIRLSGYKNEVIRHQTVYWFKNRLFNENVSLSYAAYWLRKIPCFAELKNYVIDDSCWLPGSHYETLSVGSEYSDKEMLKALGAKMNFSEFTARELYDAINNVTAMYEDGVLNENEVLEHYLSLIKALDAKNATPSSENVTLRLVCRKDGEHMVLNSDQVYYSDNNEFPLEVRKTLPLLLMRSRQGEQKLQRILGCKTLKDISVQIDSNSSNERLTRELNRHIEERKAYFLAFSSLGVGKKGKKSETLFNETYKSAISNFNLTVIFGVSCRYGDDSAPIQMKDEGELLVVGERFYVCSDSRSLSDAMNNPRFNSSVIEALCLKLNLQGFELSDKFYRVFTSGVKELEYYRIQEVYEELWLECQSQFDYSAEDIDFWRKVFQINDKIFGLDDLKHGKASYISETLEIRPERCRNVRSFLAYHRQELQVVREKYMKDYFHYIYTQLCDDIDKHKEYCSKLAEYTDDVWLENLLNEEDNMYQTALDYDALIRNAVLRKFECSLPVEGAVEHKKIERYLIGLNCFNMNYEEESLLFFEGHDKAFDGLREEQKHDSDVSDSNPSDKTTIQVCDIVELSISKPKDDKGESAKDAEKSYGSKGSRNISEKRKVQLGNNAEDAVYESISNSQEYEIISVCSSHLAKNNKGNDSAGYDLVYKKKDETMHRYLEIKHSDGKSILLTANEYEVSQKEEYKDCYDIALYDGKKVTILRSPLADSQNFDLLANDYTVRFTLEK